MKIKDVEEFIKSRKPEEISASQKIEEKLNDRKLELEKIKEIISNNDIVGILGQEGNVYKSWFKYEQNKDLNIIVRIKGNNLYIVSAFPCEIERRVKHEKTKREKGEI